MGKLTSTYASELLHALKEAGFERFDESAARTVALRCLGVASPSSVRRYLDYLLAVGEVKRDSRPGLWVVRRSDG